MYNDLQRNHIGPKIDNVLASGEIDPRPHKFWLSGEFFKVYAQKTYRQQYLSNLLRPLTPFTEERWSKSFSHTAYKKQSVIMMLNRNTMVKVRSPNGDTDYFDIVTGVLQGDTLASYLIIYLHYVLRTSIDKIKENCFKLIKESRRYPAKTITDTDYADDIALLVNAPAQAETLLHSLERAAAGIGLHVNAHKTEYMCFSQTGDISTVNGSALKLADKFTYLGSSLIKRDRHWHTSSYRLAIGRMEVRPDR